MHARVAAEPAHLLAGQPARVRGDLLARLVGSTGVGELLDTVVFCSIAATAIGISTVGQWANYTLFGFLYKITVQYAVMPATMYAIRVIKRREPSYQAALASESSTGTPD